MMKPAAQKSLLAVAATVLVIFCAWLTFTGLHDPDARIRAIALEEVAKRTHTPESSWIIHECRYDGKTWTVCATAIQLKGRIIMTISSTGEVLTFGPAHEPKETGAPTR